VDPCFEKGNGKAGIHTKRKWAAQPPFHSYHPAVRPSSRTITSLVEAPATPSPDTIPSNSDLEYEVSVVISPKYQDDISKLPEPSDRGKAREEFPGTEEGEITEEDMTREMMEKFINDRFGDIFRITKSVATQFTDKLESEVNNKKVIKVLSVCKRIKD